MIPFVFPFHLVAALENAHSLIEIWIQPHLQMHLLENEFGRQDIAALCSVALKIEPSCAFTCFPCFPFILALESILALIEIGAQLHLQLCIQASRFRRHDFAALAAAILMAEPPPDPPRFPSLYLVATLGPY